VWLDAVGDVADDVVEDIDGVAEGTDGGLELIADNVCGEGGDEVKLQAAAVKSCTGGSQQSPSDKLQQYSASPLLSLRPSRIVQLKICTPLIAS
jgi:hypothetical protein